MPPDSYVLLVDDCPQSRHDLRLILEFLGEEPFPVASTDWQALVEKQIGSSAAVKCVIVGECDSPGGLASLVEQLDAWDAHVPVVVIGRDRVVGWPDYVRQRLLSTAELPLTYNQLLDILHRAQVYREVFDEGLRKHQREPSRSEEHTSELQSRPHLVCRLL